MKKNQQVPVVDRQVLGVDVGKDLLVVCFSIREETMFQKVIARESFANTPDGFRKLHRWLSRFIMNRFLPCTCVMEATGVYHESLAYFLHEQHYPVVILLPNKSRHYALSLPGKSKTDAIDAEMLARYGLERSSPLWEPAKPVYRALRALTRELRQKQEEMTRIKNQIHAKHHAYEPLKETVNRMKRTLAMYQRQAKKIVSEILATLATDAALCERVRTCATIIGLRTLSVVVVVAETQGFALVENLKQLASYAGYDVVHRQSGKHIGQTSISKKGNRYIRAALYMPAICAARYNPALREYYHRVVEKRGIKKIGTIAIARKLLGLIWTIWKSGVPFDPNYGRLPTDECCETTLNLRTPRPENHQETRVGTDTMACDNHEATLPHVNLPCVAADGSQEPSSVHTLLTAKVRDAIIPMRECCASALISIATSVNEISGNYLSTA
jgi:transposase